MNTYLELICLGGLFVLILRLIKHGDEATKQQADIRLSLNRLQEELKTILSPLADALRKTQVLEPLDKPRDQILSGIPSIT